MKTEKEIRRKIVRLIGKTIRDKLDNGETGILTLSYLNECALELLWVLNEPEYVQEAIIRTLFEEGAKRIGLNKPIELKKLTQKEREDLGDEIFLLVRSDEDAERIWNEAKMFCSLIETTAPLYTIF